MGSMSNAERAKYRKIQDAFLARPEIKKAIAENGWDSPIAWGNGGSPTYAELRDQIHTAWVPWLIDFMREE
ncbi:hypothetical protein R5W24_004470 [Gemmata sp. JC717]|uniref:hypothetical protein n=1 Tax=Gemmata algarum TaxID=2975278 RepID=UPI0021BA5052|nr:hypothetical protein [Gemmata algarum]MDY3555328.1 hypothetical protein [Gemmata algarum]